MSPGKRKKKYFTSVRIRKLHIFILKTLLTPVLGSFMRTLVSLTGKIGFFGGLVQNRFYGGF
jgi:hypothetical protein